jgi:hypothetical protein
MIIIFFLYQQSGFYYVEHVFKKKKDYKNLFLDL